MNDTGKTAKKSASKSTSKNTSKATSKSVSKKKAPAKVGKVAKVGVGKKKALTKVYGIIVLSTGGLAKALFDEAEAVVGKQKNASAFTVLEHEDIALQKTNLENLVQKVDSGAGVIIAVDYFGSAASNLALELADRKDVELLAGMNLTMLLRLIALRPDVSFELAAQRALESARQAVENAKSILQSAKNA